MTEALAELERIVGCKRLPPRNRCVCGQFCDTNLMGRKSQRHPTEDYVIPNEPEARLVICYRCGHSSVIYRGPGHDLKRDLTRDEAIKLREAGWDILRLQVDPIVERMIG